ncbi:MAG: hypothetical protein ACOYMN_14820 [Roseimicrobium sp.]
MPESENQPIPGLGQIHADAPAETSLTEDPSSKKEEKKLFGDARRNEEIKAEFHWAFVWLLRAASIAFIAVFLTRMIHFILPETSAQACVHGWLLDTQLQSMDKFFFSGALGALISRYLKEIVPGSGK